MSKHTISIKSASLQDLSTMLVLWDILKDSDQWSEDHMQPTCIYTVSDRQAEHAFRVLCLRMIDFMDRWSEEDELFRTWHNDDDRFRPGIVEVLEEVLEFFRRAKGEVTK